MSKPALGRGLGALLGGGAKTAAPAPSISAVAAPAAGTVLESVPSAGGARRVALDSVRPSPLQPRKDFQDESLAELAESIRSQGIVQPLIVRAQADHLELIAGERRWRAARLAGLTEVPVLVREASDRDVLELALIENLQRENLNPIEEALGFSQLAEQFKLTQEQVATKVGRSRASVANSLRLLRLPKEVQGVLREGKLSVGHAKVLLSVTDPKAVVSAAQLAVVEGWSVRQTEEFVSRLNQPNPDGRTRGTGSMPAPVRDPHVVDLEGRLQERLGTKVSLRYRQGRGSVEIRYFSDAELDRILSILGVSAD